MKIKFQKRWTIFWTFFAMGLAFLAIGLEKQRHILSEKDPDPIKSEKELATIEIIKKGKGILDEAFLDANRNSLPGRLSALSSVSVPSENPQTEEKVQLGMRLFFDPRLSRDGRMSCNSCHDPRHAFVDGMEYPSIFRNIRNELVRHTPTLLNIAYDKVFNWDGRATSLEEQAVEHLLSRIGLNGDKRKILSLVISDHDYRNQFQRVFGQDPTLEDIGKALAAFERTLITPNSRYDLYMKGYTNALDSREKNGLFLFVGKASCSNCHKGQNFTDNNFYNLGIVQEETLKEDLGRFNFTKNKKDRRAFKTPSLRNIALTAPYMHNGTIKTLEEVIDFYNYGCSDDPELTVELNLTLGEKRDLIAFLMTLTGEQPKIDQYYKLMKVTKRS